MPRHSIAVLAFLAGLCIDNLRAQSPTSVPPATDTQAPVRSPEENEVRTWTFGASVYTYFVADDREYVVPTITADRDFLHLEFRYNYESLDTASLWVGYNFAVGDDLRLEFTPMLGAVFGELDGVAPAYRGSLSWQGLEFFSEGEYVLDTNDSSANFFYSWSELTFAPIESFRFGLVTQRTRLYESDRDIQRGILVGYSGGAWDISGYLFDPDESSPTFVLSFGGGF